MISRPLLLRALWSHLVFQHLGADEERMAKFRRSALRLTTGWEQTRINTIVREALIEVIEPIVFDEALQLIRDHQADGRRVFIISASPEEIVAPLAQYLGVDEAIASRALLDADGRYTGDVEFYSYGPFKAEAMREAAELHDIDLEASYAYSDSITDLPMLEAVGHPVVVNPDRELGRIARTRGWEVRIFRHRVPLRERVSMPPPRVAATLAGALVGVLAGGLTWWLLARRLPPPAPARRLVVLAPQPGARTGPVRGAGRGGPSTSGRDRRWRPAPRRATSPGRAGRGGRRPGARRPGASSPRTRRDRRR
jgi:HAD superfamily hydrolase (TIGR01490 family)